MSLKLNGATSGSIELDVPDAIGSDLNITIPGAAGTLDRLERAGNILQVVQGTSTAFASNTTSTFTDTGLSATINVSSASSDIYIVAYTGMIGKSGGDTQWDGRILRGASTEVMSFASLNSGNADTQASTSTFICKDNPSTTGSLTYKLQFKNRNAVGSCLFNLNGTAVMLILEVAG